MPCDNALLGLQVGFQRPDANFMCAAQQNAVAAREHVTEFAERRGAYLGLRFDQPARAVVREEAVA